MPAHEDPNRKSTSAVPAGPRDSPVQYSLMMEQADWTHRYEDGDTKWDLGRSPEQLLEFMESVPKGRKILIPGCGRGYEIADLHRLGHVVTAVDCSAGAVAAARDEIGALADGILCADFFDCELPAGHFDLCYERTFLCALPAGLRPGYGPRIAELLKDGGLLIGIFHYGCPVDEDPPFPMTGDQCAEILERCFSLVDDRPCCSGLPVFADHDERWQVWRKRPATRPGRAIPARPVGRRGKTAEER